MRKLNVVALGLLLAGGLTSCAAATPADQALALCKESVERQLPGRDIDFGDLEAVNMTDTLFDAKITDKKDARDALYTVAGEITAELDGSTTRHSVICMANDEDGEVTMKNTATVTGS